MAYKLSPSKLHLLEDCPKCFWLDMNKGIKRPEGIFPSLPSGMDKVLKEHFDNFRDIGKVPPELNGLKGIKLFDDKKLLDEWRNARKGIRWADNNGNVLCGAVDNLLVKSGKIIVIDYKTRGFPLKEDTAAYYQAQLDIYNFLLRNNGYKTENYAYLLFYHPTRVNENGYVMFHTDLVKMAISVDNAGKIFQNALEVLVGEMPEASDKCGYCGMVSQRK